MKKLWLACCVAGFGTGCLKTYVKRAPSLTPDAQFPTVMVHTGVNVQQHSDPEVNSRADLVAIASDVIQNSLLDEFGETLLDATKPFLESHGLDVVVAPERVKRAQSVDWGEVGNALTIVTGGWTDPRGTVLPLVPRSLFRSGLYAKMGTTLHEGGEPEGYLYVVGTIHERGLFFPYPKLALTFVVHDHRGAELLLAQGVGLGNRQFFVVDRSPLNLSLALDEALRELEKSQTQGL